MLKALKDRLIQLDKDSESGAAMVEFVMVFPFQLVLTLAILQFAFIAHAHIVTYQAAAMGARAAVVADGMEGYSQRDAALRVVARTVATLASGETRTPGTPTAGGRLEWTSQGGKHGFSDAQQAETYGHLRVDINPPNPQTQSQRGYLACDVHYDYVMWIPVANHIFAGGMGFWWGNGAGYDAVSQTRRMTVFRVHRVGFAAIPWAEAPR